MKGILILTYLLTLIQQGIACSCVYPTEISKAFVASKTVVYGEIVELKIIKVSDSMDPDSLRHYLQKEELNDLQSEILNSDFLIQAKLRIIELFKGEINNETLTLYTTRTGASCGFTGFEIGKQFIIYSSPNSYFFSHFYQPQGNRRLEKANTNWVTSCSITTALREDHLNMLQVIKIAREGLNILKTKDLLKNENKIYSTVLVKNYEGKFDHILFENDEIITNNELKRQDLILTLLSIQGNIAELSFKSFDDGGFVHNGTIKLVKNKREWAKDSMNYLSAIE
ncbi:MAG: hypothetical protein IPK88_05560 [Saprospiraceae bacterium]|nr:hypothetical protein [Candidatus Defluviibacterium haderslevense]